MKKTDQYKLGGGKTTECRVRTQSLKTLFPEETSKIVRARNSYRPERRFSEYKFEEKE